MTTSKESDERQRRAREEAARKRRLAEVFGDVVPEQTSDDAAPDEPGENRDEWFKRQVPPHHGD